MVSMDLQAVQCLKMKDTIFNVYNRSQKVIVSECEYNCPNRAMNLTVSVFIVMILLIKINVVYKSVEIPLMILCSQMKTRH